MAKKRSYIKDYGFKVILLFERLIARASILGNPTFFDTPDFPAEERLAAYEMANTCMGELSLLLPPPQKLGYWRYYRRAVGLFWRHCPQRIPGFLIGRVIDTLRRRLLRNPNRRHGGRNTEG